MIIFVDLEKPLFDKIGGLRDSLDEVAEFKLARVG